MSIHLLRPTASIREMVRCMLLERGSPEAAELFAIIMRYSHKRVFRVSRRRGSLLSSCDREEIVADVLLCLMEGSLARFQGDSLAQLLAFVRTIADRMTWRACRRRQAEQEALRGADADLIRDWMSKPPSPDSAEVDVVSPLSNGDQAYLRELLIAGGKASLSRRAGVSRAAVTQRVARIQVRVAELSAMDRVAHGVWLQQAARQALMQA